MPVLIDSKKEPSMLSTFYKEISLKSFEKLPETVYNEIEFLDVSKLKSDYNSFTELRGIKIHSSSSSSLSIESSNIGEIIAADTVLGLGLAVFRLDALNSNSPSKFYFNKIKSEEKSSELHDSAFYIHPFQPFWWPTIDPHTGRAIKS